MNNGHPLPAFTSVTREGLKVSATFSSGQFTVVSAELNYTADSGAWKERKWDALPIAVNACGGAIAADIPAQATVYYLNLFTDNGLAISSQHEELTGQHGE